MQKRYREEVRAKLRSEFNYKNEMQIPKLEKIVINMGVGEATGDQKKLDAAVAELAAIAGQTPGEDGRQEGDRRVQDPRRACRSAARSRFAGRACMSSWIAW